MPPEPRPAARLAARRTAAARDGLARGPVRNLAIGLAYMLCVMAAAVTAYVRAGWSLGDALYFVVITVYTVGYDEVLPINTPLLRAITIATIMLGCTGMIFLTGVIVQAITLNQLNQLLGVRRMNTQIDQLRDHVIICGFGRTGAMLARELAAGGMKLVVIEQAEAEAAAAREQGHLCLQADASSEATLEAAGIGRARALTAVLSSDATNVFITLSARSLNPGLTIIARGELLSTERKLLQAGANKVVLPAHAGAERMAEMIMYSETERFIHGTERMRAFERTLHAFGLDIDVVAVAADSAAAGQTVEWVERYARGAFFVVQIDRQHGEIVSHPGPATVIHKGDGLVLLGRGDKARALRAVFQKGGKARFWAPAR